MAPEEFHQGRLAAQGCRVEAFAVAIDGRKERDGLADLDARGGDFLAADGDGEGQ